MTLNNLLEKMPPIPRMFIAGLINQHSSKEEQEQLSQDIEDFSIALKEENGDAIIAILKKYRINDYL